MCFHSKQSKKAQVLENRFKATFVEKELFHPTNHYNGFDFPKTPVITNEDASKIQMVKWGLIPSWSLDNSINKYTLNARLETLNEKPAFKNSVQNRCIVLVDGFYEWQHKGSTKHKFEIGYNNEIFAFAGLYDINNDLKTYTIVTTEAKGVMREIHNTKYRMPYSLVTDKSIKEWLKGDYPIPFENFSTIPTLGNQLTFFT